MMMIMMIIMLILFIHLFISVLFKQGCLLTENTVGLEGPG